MGERSPCCCFKATSKGACRPQVPRRARTSSSGKKVKLPGETFMGNNPNRLHRKQKTSPTKTGIKLIRCSAGFLLMQSARPFPCGYQKSSSHRAKLLLSQAAHKHQYQRHPLLCRKVSFYNSPKENQHFKNTPCRHSRRQLKYLVQACRRKRREMHSST